VTTVCGMVLYARCNTRASYEGTEKGAATRRSRRFPLYAVFLAAVLTVGAAGGRVIAPIAGVVF